MLNPFAPDRVALGANSPHARGALVVGLDHEGEPTHVVPCAKAEMVFETKGWTQLKLSFGDGTCAGYTAYDLKVEGRFHRNGEEIQ